MGERSERSCNIGCLLQLGFKKGADWLQIRFEVPEQIPPRFQRVADYSKQEFGVHVVRKTKKEITQGYSHKIFKLLNESFAHPASL